MRTVTRNSLRYLQFELLSRESSIVHGVFTRHGGVSPSPYGSLNVGLATGDASENVRINEHRITQALGFSSMAKVHQVHGDALAIVDGTLPAPETQADALATARPGTGLMIKLADCQSVMLFDPVSRIVANIHNGWRGSVQNIVGKTIRRLVDESNVRSESIIAAVGPSLGPCCAEFVDYERMFPREWERYHVGCKHIDFWSLTRDQLIAAGVAPDRIEIAEICTKCGTGDFFSYRGEKTTGRFAAVIGLRSDTADVPAV